MAISCIMTSSAWFSFPIVKGEQWCLPTCSEFYSRSTNKAMQMLDFKKRIIIYFGW